MYCLGHLPGTRTLKTILAKRSLILLTVIWAYKLRQMNNKVFISPLENSHPLLNNCVICLCYPICKPDDLEQ